MGVEDDESPWGLGDGTELGVGPTNAGLAAAGMAGIAALMAAGVKLNRGIEVGVGIGVAVVVEQVEVEKEVEE